MLYSCDTVALSEMNTDETSSVGSNTDETTSVASDDGATTSLSPAAPAPDAKGNSAG